ncbi:hypothetical protein [Arthrobacter sp. 92]|uniref:hypothetical protein n=1 Tax=Arthrobacter sp. 92 TaxID=3418175 RepID=UPI003D037538
MTSKLDVTVAVDMDSGTITAPDGKLTLRNVHGLLPVAHRATSLEPDSSLTVDPSALAAADPAAVQVLRSGCPQNTRFLGPGVPDTAQPRSGRHRLPGIRRAAAQRAAA